MASSVFIMPSVLVVLLLAIFPLIISLYLSLSRFKFVKGGFEIKFVGLANFHKLFLGSEQEHFLGVLAIELNMTQIAEQIGIHKSTVHRLLKTLEKKRFVERDTATGVYRLGIQLLQMAYLTLEQNDLRRLAATFLRRLWEQHRETVHLAVLDQADVVFLDAIESPQRVKLAAAIGQRLPAFATASGRAILAFMPDEAVQDILKRGMPQYTRHTRSSPETFFDGLRPVQEKRICARRAGI